MIRVLVSWAGTTTPVNANPDLWIDPMPAVPHKGDLVDLTEMIDQNDPRLSTFSQAEHDEFFGLAFSVDYVVWKKDKDGYFVNLSLLGE